MLRPFIYHDADDGQNTQGGSGGTNEQGSQQQSGQRADPTQAFQNLLARHNNDALALASRLFDENWQYRYEIRTLKEQQAPQGALILTGDEATAWQQYQQLGKADDLAKRITDADAAQQRLAALEREQTLTKAALASGYKASVLSKLPDLPTVIVKDVTVDGTTQQQPFVTTEQGEQPLTAYVEAQYAEFLPALRADAQGAAGTPYPAQRPPAHGTERVSRLDQEAQRLQARRDARPNPLLKTAS